mmetsp:Transcript_17873/g.50022  ORF Transcript_17873/g.50022 Transcript_17873/m.50022 type:complete len:242 (-) Transcript_17873:1982-2707(-)
MGLPATKPVGPLRGVLQLVVVKVQEEGVELAPAGLPKLVAAVVPEVGIQVHRHLTQHAVKEGALPQLVGDVLSQGVMAQVGHCKVVDHLVAQPLPGAGGEVALSQQHHQQPDPTDSARQLSLLHLGWVRGGTTALSPRGYHTPHELLCPKGIKDGHHRLRLVVPWHRRQPQLQDEVVHVHGAVPPPHVAVDELQMAHGLAVAQPHPPPDLSCPHKDTQRVCCNHLPGRQNRELRGSVAVRA